MKLIAILGAFLAVATPLYAQYSVPAALIIDCASPDAGDIGKQVDFAGTPVTSANPQDSVGVLIDVQSSTYYIASPMWYTGNALVTFSGVSTAFPAGAWLVLDGSGNHVLETDPGNEVRVARVADHEDNIFSMSLTNKVAAVPVNPHYAALPDGVQRTRATTNGSGVYTWTFGTAFAVTPVVTALTEENTSGVISTVKVTSISSSAVTVQVTSTTTTSLLGFNLLLVDNPSATVVHLTARAP